LGVDVEVAPFIKPTNVQLGQLGKGSYIEFSITKSQWLFSSKLLVKNVKNLDSLAQCCNFQKNNEL
jgi:hypothetical protein